MSKHRFNSMSPESNAFQNPSPAMPGIPDNPMPRSVQFLKQPAVICPNTRCKSEQSRIIDSRMVSDTLRMRRHRCNKCAEIYSSYEHLKTEPDAPVKNEQDEPEF